MTSKTNRQATVAPAMPAVAREPDPIFDLIATHREASARYGTSTPSISRRRPRQSLLRSTTSLIRAPTPRWTS